MVVAINILLLIAIVSANPANAEQFKLSIVHYNDFHSRFEQTNAKGGLCTPDLLSKNECVGGFPRMYSEIMRLMKVNKNPILLDAGDDFFGSNLYSLFRWNIVAEFLNKLPLDAVVLGNHEFNDEVSGLLPYIEKLKATIVVANIDDSREPTFQGKVQDSTTVQREGRDIGIIGYMHSHMNEIAKTGQLTFTDEVEAVNRVAAKLKASGVGIIVTVSHAGIDVDIRVAENCPDVDVVVGGHTHTFLYTGPPPSDEKVYGDYPFVVTQKSGRKVLVVQALSYSRYLGNLEVTFDGAGEMVDWNGAPIYLDHTIKEDAEILSALEPWKQNLTRVEKEVIGSTKVNLDLMTCFPGECNLLNFVTDAMVYEHLNKSVLGESWTYASIAALNVGTLRYSIDEKAANGDITYGDLLALLPFQGRFDVIELQGKYILEALEFSVARENRDKDHEDENPEFHGKFFLHWSGVRVKFDMNQPIGSRVLQPVMVRCRECRVPQFEPLDMEKYYRIVMDAYHVDGGDAYTLIRDNYRNREFGRIDSDILKEYLAKMSPLIHGLEGRIHIIPSAASGAVGLIPSLIVLLSNLLA